MVRAGRWPGIAWLIRATHNRSLTEGDKLGGRLVQGAVLGEAHFLLPTRPGRPSRPVVLTVRAKRVTRQPTGGEAVTVTALRAREKSPPADVKPLKWRLLTNRPADTLAPAGELLQWYATCWSIEVFFRILKTGCCVEAWQLRTLERLELALAWYLIIAWRIQYLTLLGRAAPDLPCEAVLDQPNDKPSTSQFTAGRPVTPPPLPVMFRWIAQLSGHLGRKSNGPSGPKALWIGLQ